MSVKRNLVNASVMIAAFTLLMIGFRDQAIAASKTLDVGLVSNLGWSAGLDTANANQLIVDMDNKKGGLDIGGEKYQINLIVYDSNNVQATEVAAINRLIYKDKVKYILSDGTFISTWLPETEKNKIVVLAHHANFRETLNPELHYCFNPSCNDTKGAILTVWFCKKFPEKIKKMVIARPDNQIGHIVAEMITGPMWRKFGANVTDIFYPPASQDLSVIGTKVKQLNPDTFMAEAGGASVDGLCFNAAYQAGYRGQIIGSLGTPTLTLLDVMSPEVAEGYITGGSAVEFDPPSTQMAKDFKDAYIAKYGKWEGIEVHYGNFYACLRTALQKAGSIDPEEVANTIADGLQFESPGGPVKMISRLDLGNERTVESLATPTYIKQIKNGKTILFESVDVDVALEYFHAAYPPMK